jgi:hypothetical protein
MNEPGAIDLSPLDPERDPERWNLLVEATRLRVAPVLSERAREPDSVSVLSSWARPILAAAVAVLLLLGGAATALGGRAPAKPSDARRLALLTESSVIHGRAPTGAELMAAVQAGAQR